MSAKSLALESYYKVEQPLTEKEAKISSYSALCLSIIFGSMFLVASYNTIRFLICNKIRAFKNRADESYKPISYAAIVWLFYIQVLLCTLVLSCMFAYLYTEPDEYYIHQVDAKDDDTIESVVLLDIGVDFAFAILGTIILMMYHLLLGL